MLSGSRPWKFSGCRHLPCAIVPQCGASISHGLPCTILMSRTHVPWECTLHCDCKSDLQCLQHHDGEREHGHRGRSKRDVYLRPYPASLAEMVPMSQGSGSDERVTIASGEEKPYSTSQGPTCKGPDGTRWDQMILHARPSDWR